MVAFSPVCPQELLHITPEQVERLIPQGLDRDQSCYQDALVRAQAQAVPVLVRLLRDEREASQVSAMQVVKKLGSTAVATLPDLMTLLRSKVAQLDTLQAQGGAGQAQEHAQHMVQLTAHAITSVGPAAQAAIPELLALYGRPDFPYPSRYMLLQYLWAMAEASDTARLALVAGLLAKETLTNEEAEMIAPSLIRMGSRASPLLPALRASLHKSGGSLIEAYLAVQGDEVGIPYLFQSAGMVVDPLKKRGPLADRYVADAIRQASSRSAAITVLARNIDSPGAIAHLIDKLGDPSTADSAAAAFITINRKFPQANEKLLASLLAAGNRDPLRRDLFLRAMDVTGPVAQIPRSLLVDGLRSDLRLARRQAPQGPQVACLPATILWKAGLLSPSDLPMLKRAYRDAAQSGAHACLSETVDLIASLASRPALEFLYERFLASNDEQHMQDLQRALMRNIAPLAPRLEASIGRLRGARLVMVESMLLAPGGEEVLAAYRARILPGLLALPFKADAHRLLLAPYSEYQASFGISPGMRSTDTPATRGGLAVLRMDRIAPRTPELVSLLLRLVAGSNEDAAKQAMLLLQNIRDEQRGLRAACFRQIGQLLVETPLGPAQRRLATLERVYAYSRRDHDRSPVQ